MLSGPYFCVRRNCPLPRLISIFITLEILFKLVKWIFDSMLRKLTTIMVLLAEAEKIVFIVPKRYLKVLLHLFIILWLVFTYQVMWDKNNNKVHQLPLWESKKFSVDFIKCRIDRSQNLFCLFSSSKTSLYGLCKEKEYAFFLLILLICLDVERNPGPENWHSMKHPKLCGYFRTAVFFVSKNKNLFQKMKRISNQWT